MAETEALDQSNMVLTPVEREAAVQRLSTAFADDLLQVEEFERRLDAAYRATIRADLNRLTVDLPEISPASQALAGEFTPLPREMRAAFASVERSGMLEVPTRLDVNVVFGSLELDLRTARFQPGVTEIVVSSIFANVEIRLPPHVSAENHADGFFASFQCRMAVAYDGAAPVARVRIVGRAILSNVEVVSAGSGKNLGAIGRGSSKAR